MIQDRIVITHSFGRQKIGESNLSEGISNIILGASGNGHTTAVNPICDTLFGGNQTLYSIAEAATIMGAGAVTAYNNPGLLPVEGVKPPKINLTDNELIAQVMKNGEKINPDNVVMIVKTAGGKIVWLEKGNATAGLNHILKHTEDFASKGISAKQIPKLLKEAISNGKVVGYQGKGTDRPIYEVIFNGVKQKVAITVSDNGFIVGANPK